MEILQEIKDAEGRIAPWLLKTPLLYSPYLSKFSGGKVFLKMESEQYTGSFKARGAVNKLAYLKEKGVKDEVITASTGNHGMAVAWALSRLGMKGRIIIPENAVSTKVEALKSFGAEVEQYGSDCLESELYAKELGRKNDLIYISPYNDPQVIGGQGTIGIEIVDQCPNPVDGVFVTIGGGGLISGISVFMKSIHPQTKILGCQPGNSPEMTLSVRADSYQTVESRETLSDGSAGPFEEGAITYDLCKQYVDDFYLLSETQIGAAVKLILSKERKLIEGAAGVAVAAFLQEAETWAGKTVVIVICGGNISVDNLKKIL